MATCMALLKLTPSEFKLGRDENLDWSFGVELSGRKGLFYNIMNKHLTINSLELDNK